MTTTRTHIKQGDTAPALVALLVENSDGSAVDLTAASAVRIIVGRHRDTGTPIIDAACTITDAAAGEVTYSWQTGDTADPGRYDVEYEIAWNDGTYQTAPSQGFNRLVIWDDLGGTV